MPYKRRTLENHGENHTGFPSASCQFWSISYNLSQFLELQRRLPTESLSAFTSWRTRKREIWARRWQVTTIKISQLYCPWQKQTAWFKRAMVTAWTPTGCSHRDRMSVTGMTRAPECQSPRGSLRYTSLKKFISERASWFNINVAMTSKFIFR